MKLNTLALSLASLFLALPVQSIHGDDNTTFTSVRLIIGEDGAGVLTVDSRPADKSEQSKPTEPVNLKAFGKATVSKLKDGRLDVNYDFSKVTDTADLIPASLSPQARKILEQQLSIDTDEGVLVLIPDETKRIHLPFPRMVRPPFEMQVDLIGHSEGLLQLTAAPGGYLIGVSLHGGNTPEKDVEPSTIVVFERPGPKEQFKVLLKVKHGSSEQREYKFRVNDDAIKRNTQLGIGYLSEVPLAIRKIQVTANFPASFGMALEKRGTRVMVTQILKDSAAEEAGIKKGDILLTVDSKPASDTAIALKLLAECGIGTPIDVDVLRFGKKKTIAVTPK